MMQEFKFNASIIKTIFLFVIAILLGILWIGLLAFGLLDIGVALFLSVAFLGIMAVCIYFALYFVKYKIVIDDNKILKIFNVFNIIEYRIDNLKTIEVINTMNIKRVIFLDSNNQTLFLMNKSEVPRTFRKYLKNNFTIVYSRFNTYDRF